MNKTTLIAFAVGMIALLGFELVAAFGFGEMTKDLTDAEKAEMREQRESMQSAINDGDYATWKNLMGQRVTKIQEEITEENFAKIQERNLQMSKIREAIESGDYENAEKLREEFGIQGKGFRMGMMHSGFGGCPHAK